LIHHRFSERAFATTRTLAKRYRGMASPSRKRRLGAEAHRALALLAGSPDGVNGALLLAHGFSRRLLASLVRVSLATWHRKTVRVGGRTIDVGYMMITAAGRREIEASLKTMIP
jgi:hypothetical protein